MSAADIAATKAVRRNSMAGRRGSIRGLSCRRLVRRDTGVVSASKFAAKFREEHLSAANCRLVKRRGALVMPSIRLTTRRNAIVDKSSGIMAHLDALTKQTLCLTSGVLLDQLASHMPPDMPHDAQQLVGTCSPKRRLSAAIDWENIRRDVVSMPSFSSGSQSRLSLRRGSLRPRSQSLVLEAPSLDLELGEAHV